MSAGTIERERLLLVERLRGVPDTDWDRDTPCAGWTVRHVLAHLVTPFEVSAPAMALAVTRHRSIGRAMDHAARRLAAERSTTLLLETLEHHAGSTFRPPGLPLGAPLTDIVVHSADVRLSLGDPPDDWAAPERLLPALEFLVSGRARIGFVPPDRLRGLRLVADDQPWEHGDGPLVRGPSLALVLAALGRDAGLSRVGGDGAPTLRERCA